MKHLANYCKKFKGTSEKAPSPPKFKRVLFIWLGGFLAAAAVGYLASISGQPLVLGSFGASIFVLFVLPETPLAQPRNVVGGHFISTLIGLFFFHCIGPEWWSMALALATAIAAMQLFRVAHPPAGSNPFIVFLSKPDWDFLFMPTLLGAIVLVLVALLYNNLQKNGYYPKYWI